MKNKNGKNIILGITGSIAAYKACELVRLFRKSGFDVSCVFTKEAGYFVTPLTMETLSGNKVYQDMFELPENRAPQHTSLADKADAIVVYPASANLIGKLANGICDDLLTCTIYASRAPVFIAPAMNDNMYNHKAVQKNIRVLKETGYSFIGPVSGALACGHTAIGHVSPAETIFNEVKKSIK